MCLIFEFFRFLTVFITSFFAPIGEVAFSSKAIKEIPKGRNDKFSELKRFPQLLQDMTNINVMTN